MQRIAYIVAIWLTGMTSLHAQPIRVAAIGDSITFGAGIGNPADAYPAQLQELLGVGYDVQNFGRSGADVLNINNGPYAGTQEHQDALAFVPEIVVSNLGINDSGLFLDNQQAFVDDYVALLNQYAALPTTPTIYLWTQLAPVFSGNANFELINSQRTIVNARLTELATAVGAQGINMYAPLKDHPEWFPDSLHPNGDGAAVIAAVTHATLTSPPWNGVAGDVNQDGVFSGNGVGPVETDDVSAFIAGWGSTGLIGSFNQVTAGDLNFDSATTLADAFIMHELLAAEGVAFPFQRLNVRGVPEPNGLCAAAGMLIAASILCRRSRRAVGCVIACCCLMFVAAGLDGVATAADVDVYILTGQSNSLGTTSLEGSAVADYGPGDHAADAETQVFWSNVSSTNTVYPPVLYGDSGGAITSLQMQQGDGGSNLAFWGPEYGFARTMFDAGQADVLIVKASRGGGGNSFWDKAIFDANNNNGHMWGHVTDTVDAALAAIVGRGDDFSIMGLMYLQGESNNSAQAAAADARLADFISNLKSHVNASYANAANHMHTAVGEKAASGFNGNRIQTTQLQISLAAGDPNITFVATSDLPLKSDGIHFGRDAKLTIGNRFADAFISNLDQPNGVAGDVNQDGMVSGNGSGLPEVDDVTAFIAGWRSDTVGLTNLAKTLAGDLNLDGETSLPDAFILHEAFEAEGFALDFALLNEAVPEPTTATLVVLALLGWPRPKRSY